MRCEMWSRISICLTRRGGHSFEVNTDIKVSEGLAVFIIISWPPGQWSEIAALSSNNKGWYDYNITIDWTYIILYLGDSASLRPSQYSEVWRNIEIRMVFLYNGLDCCVVFQRFPIAHCEGKSFCKSLI